MHARPRQTNRQMDEHHGNNATILLNDENATIDKCTESATPTIVDITLMINPQLPYPHHQLRPLTASLVVDKVIDKELFELSNCQQLYAGRVTDLRQQDSSERLQ